MEIAFDPARMDFARTLQLLRDTYWGGGRSDEINRKAFAHSICAIALIDGEPVGFARACGDRTLYARISDVIVWPAHRGRGIGKALIGALLDHPELATVRTWTLTTADAHGLYEAFGFRRLTDGNEMRLDRRPPMEAA